MHRSPAGPPTVCRVAAGGKARGYVDETICVWRGDGTTAGEAYEYLNAPDAALGLASYAATLVLAGMGSDRRAEERPWIPLALAAKVGLDAVSALYLTVEQGTKHRRFCSWCLVGAGLSAAMVPQVMPEARAAWGHLRSRTS